MITYITKLKRTIIYVIFFGYLYILVKTIISYLLKLLLNIKEIIRNQRGGEK